MNRNQKIKVIKKVEAGQAPVNGRQPKENPRHAAREMVSTVKNWVNDFQSRKRDETKAAIEKFLVVKPAAGEI